MTREASAMRYISGEWLRQGELRGLDWTDYTGSELAINRSIWMSVVNLPKTRASRDTVPVIPALAEILDKYRRSMGNPKAGMIFHSGNKRPISVDEVGRRVSSCGHALAVVRVARVPARARLEPVCIGSPGQSRAAHLASLEAARYQGTLY
jgi:integrase